MHKISNRSLILFLFASSFGALAMAGPAGAASGTSGTMCTAVSGNIRNPTNHLAGCTKSATGGSGVLSFVQSGNETVDTVTWKNGGTTTFDVKTKSGTDACPSGSFEIEIRTKVTGSTGAAVSIRGKVSADVCGTGKGKVSLLTGTVWKF